MKRNLISVALVNVCLFAVAQEVNDFPANIPLFNIVTEDGVMPSATIVTPPENGVGISIKSEHVPGRMTISLDNASAYDSGDYLKGESGMRIKIRGNSTGANLNQHPYKIKLSKKADIITYGNDYKNKNWALLSMRTWNSVLKNEESNIQTITGLAVCRALDFLWTPRTRFANVVINDKYQGLYHLIETVEKDKKRIKIDDSGFIIENDAFWWNENGEYFKTAHLPEYMGYTFKYPEYDEMTDDERLAIKDYMDNVENALFTQKGIENYIDYTSFARWILAHDILGSNDVAGSNMFIYKETFGSDAPYDSKLMMGTPWDFDSSFKIDDTSWSGQHTSDVFYYPQLFKDEKFRKEYKRLYDEKINSVYPYVENCLNELKNNYGVAFEQSIILHRKVYENECLNSLDDQIDDMLNHLKTRLASLENLMKEFETESNISDVMTKNSALVKRVNIAGCDFTNVCQTSLPAGVYVETFTDGTTRKIYK